jgi:hypothetical protein
MRNAPEVWQVRRHYTPINMMQSNSIAPTTVHGNQKVKWTSTSLRPKSATQIQQRVYVPPRSHGIYNWAAGRANTPIFASGNRTKPQIRDEMTREKTKIKRLDRELKRL